MRLYFADATSETRLVSALRRLLAWIAAAGLLGCAQLPPAAPLSAATPDKPKVVLDALWSDNSTDPAIIQSLKSARHEASAAGKTVPSAQAAADLPLVDAASAPPRTVGTQTGSPHEAFRSQRAAQGPNVYVFDLRSTPSPQSPSLDGSGDPSYQRAPDPDDVSIHRFHREGGTEGDEGDVIVVKFSGSDSELEPLADRLSIDGIPTQARVDSIDALRNVRLNGVVAGGDGRKMAILEVEGSGTHVVSEGKTIVVPGGSQNHILSVRRILDQKIIVGVGERGQEFVVQ